MKVVEELYPDLGKEEDENENNNEKKEDELEKELAKLRDQKKRLFFNFETNVGVPIYNC